MSERSLSSEPATPHRGRSLSDFPPRLFALIFTPVAVLILVGAWFLIRDRIEREMTLIRASETNSVVMGVGRLDDELHLPLQHLRALANDADVRRAVSDPEPEAIGALQAIFFRLIAGNAIYDKVRWVDESGRERLRADRVGTQALLVPAEQLQDLGARYYFRESLRLKPGQVFISPLDLNTEHGKVEVPHKPVLRLATHVQDLNGTDRGILIINVAARHILDDFTASIGDIRDHAMLLNSAGYWLKGPDSENEWGFMFGREETLGKAFPAAWKAIQEIPVGQIELADGLWTWSTVYPLKVSDNEGVTDVPHWLVVSHLPTNQLAPLRADAWKTIGIVSVILLALYGLLANWLALALAAKNRARVEAARAHAEAEGMRRLGEAQERFRLLVEANTNGLLVADMEGRIVFANAALEAMFGYAKEELLGQPVDILLPEAERHGHGAKFATYMRDPAPRPMGMGRDLHGRRKDGSVLPVEVSLSAFTENGRQYVDAVIADISERQRIEARDRQAPGTPP